MSTIEELISIESLQHATGHTYRTVAGRLKAAGVTVVATQGSRRLYPAREAVHALYANRSGDGQLDPAQQRARRDAAAADKAEMELAVRRGELAVMEDVAAAWADHIAAAKVKLLGLPSKLPPLLEGKPAPVMATLIRTEVHAALRELAGG